MSRPKVIYIEKGEGKDKVRAEATEVTLRGLELHGWTVVDDGDKEEQTQEQHTGTEEN